MFAIAPILLIAYINAMLSGVFGKQSVTHSFSTILNCVNALASLMILELYLSQKVLGNLDSVTPVNCNYFDCKYGYNVLFANPGKQLPDF